MLDAIANVGGLSVVSTKNLWVARPAPAGSCDQILPVALKDAVGINRTVDLELWKLASVFY